MQHHPKQYFQHGGQEGQGEAAPPKGKHHQKKQKRRAALLKRRDKKAAPPMRRKRHHTKKRLRTQRHSKQHRPKWESKWTRGTPRYFFLLDFTFSKFYSAHKKIPPLLPSPPLPPTKKNRRERRRKKAAPPKRRRRKQHHPKGREGESSTNRKEGAEGSTTQGEEG